VFDFENNSQGTAFGITGVLFIDTATYFGRLNLAIFRVTTGRALQITRVIQTRQLGLISNLFRVTVP